METRKSGTAGNDGLLSADAAAGASASGAAEREESACIAAGSTTLPHVDPPSGHAAAPSTEEPDAEDENVIRLGRGQSEFVGTQLFPEMSVEIEQEPMDDGFDHVHEEPLGTSHHKKPPAVVPSDSDCLDLGGDDEFIVRLGTKGRTTHKGTLALEGPCRLMGGCRCRQNWISDFTARDSGNRYLTFKTALQSLSVAWSSSADVN
jgi:hypothetical protein